MSSRMGGHVCLYRQLGLVQDPLHIVAEDFFDPFLGDIQGQESTQFPGDLVNHSIGAVDYTAIVDILERILPADVCGEGAAELENAVSVLRILGDLLTLPSALGAAAGVADDKGGIGVFGRDIFQFRGGGP